MSIHGTASLLVRYDFSSLQTLWRTNSTCKAVQSKLVVDPRSPLLCPLFFHLLRRLSGLLITIRLLSFVRGTCPTPKPILSSFALGVRVHRLSVRQETQVFVENQPLVSVRGVVARDRVVFRVFHSVMLISS